MLLDWTDSAIHALLTYFPEKRHLIPRSLSFAVIEEWYFLFLLPFLQKKVKPKQQLKNAKINVSIDCWNLVTFSMLHII